MRLAVVKTLHSFLKTPTLPNDWISAPFLKLLVQNLIVEERADVRDETLNVWETALRVLCSVPSWLETVIDSQLILEWYSLAMTPLGVAIDATSLFRPSEHMSNGNGPGPERHNVDKNMLAQDLALVSVEVVLRARIATAKALAWVLAEWPDQGQPLDNVFRPILDHYIRSPSMLQKFLTAVVVEEWSHKYEERVLEREQSVQKEALLINASTLAMGLSKEILRWLQDEPPVAYHEMAMTLSRIFTESTNLIQSFAHDCKVPATSIPNLGTTIDIHGTDEGAFSISTASEVVGPIFTRLKESLGRTKKKELISLHEKRIRLESSIQHYNDIKTQHDVRVSAAFAAAYVALGLMPEKVSPIVKGIMNGIKVGHTLKLRTIVTHRVVIRMKKILIFKLVRPLQ